MDVETTTFISIETIDVYLEVWETKNFWSQPKTKKKSENQFFALVIFSRHTSKIAYISVCKYVDLHLLWEIVQVFAPQKWHVNDGFRWIVFLVSFPVRFQHFPKFTKFWVSESEKLAFDPYKPKSSQLCEMLVFNRKRSFPKFAKCYFRYVGFLYKASQICQICFRYKTEYSQICERLVFSTKPNICPSFAKLFFSWRPNLPRFANGWFSLTKRNLPKYGKSWGIYSR